MSTTIQYMQIVHLYQKLLDRAPTDAELADALDRIRGGAVSVRDIEVSLMDGGEYRRSISAQTNAVFPELEGMMTEHHVRMHIVSRYRDIVGTVPDSSTLDFLHNKYRTGYQDGAMLESLIRRISIVPLAHTSALNF